FRFRAEGRGSPDLSGVPGQRGHDRAGPVRDRRRRDHPVELRLAGGGEPRGRRHPPSSGGLGNGDVMSTTQWEAVLTMPVDEDRVNEDFMRGVRSGVNGTPTFYVNGVRHDDSWDTDTLLEALERAASS